MILALRRLAPVVPGSLVAVLLGIIAVKLLHLDEHGVSIVGPIKSGLPSSAPPTSTCATSAHSSPAASA